MDNRTKFVLFLGAALLCIGGAGVLVRTYMGSWQDELPTTVAGPALTYQPSHSGGENDISVPSEYAYITGAVKNPGVYPISGDARVFNLVEAAGGLRYDADENQINLAAPVRDGAHIHVKSAALSADDKNKKSTDSASQKGKISKTAQFVYVNTASESELCTLPGIGPSLAKKIIEYRQTHGPFQNADDLLEVSGIGRAKLSLFSSLLRF